MLIQDRPKRLVAVGGMLNWILYLVVLFFCAIPKSLPATTAQLVTGSFTGGCLIYTISVKGNAKSSNPVVSYNISLTPRSGEPIAVVDSFAVLPDKDGRFQKTVEGSWSKFEFTLKDKYKLSGSVILMDGRNLLGTSTMAFSKKYLDCRQ